MICRFESYKGDLQMKPREIYRKILKKTSVIAWMLKLINIPIAIATAKITAVVTAEAIDGNVSKVICFGGVLLLVVVGSKVIGVIAEIKYQKLLSQSLQKCKIVLYEKFFSNPQKVLYESNYGACIERFTDDFNAVTGRFTNLLPQFWTGVITLVVYFLFLAGQSVGIALALLGLSVIQLIPPVIVKKYMQVNYDNNRDIEAKETDFIVSGFRGFVLIKLYRLNEWWIEGLKKIHKEEMYYGSKAEITLASQIMLTDLMDNLLKYGSYILVGVFVIYRWTTLEAGIQAIALSTGFFDAVKDIFSRFPEFSVANKAEERLEIWFGKESEQLDMKDNHITFSNVCFKAGDKNILRDFSGDWDGERKLLIKGRNGIGKSSLLRLLTGICECSGGKIQMGGVDTGVLSGDTFPNKVFYLPQDDMNFDMSVLELCQMMIPEKMQDLLYNAKRFSLTEDLLTGVEIGKLSGGERKKAMLSLGFALNPQLMLLDEPTNSLDEAGKHVLKQLLQERNGGVIMITHEDFLDDVADGIFVMDEEGIHVEA